MLLSKLILNDCASLLLAFVTSVETAVEHILVHFAQAKTKTLKEKVGNLLILKSRYLNK